MDNTLNQTVGEQLRAEELSLRATVPPAQVPGYRLERLLGQGAFGQVWVGCNLNTGRAVAIKFYLHRSGVNWSLLTREVKNLVSMSGNRSIVQVLEVGWDAEPPYYVMELLENGSLDDLIRTRGALPIAKAIDLFSDIALGLNHSHGKGVLHCDLKPANVLLDQDLQPRLADFGQSRLSTEQTPSLGTLFYMAPEQADLNASPDARWDVYALGAILYCMLVGSPPYKTPDTVTTLDTAASLPERLKRYRDTIYKSHFPKAHYRIPGMDRWLIAIIDRCIAKNPEDRFANVQQVLAAIERRRIARIRRPLTLLGIVGPVLLLAVMALFSWQGADFIEKETSNEYRTMTFKTSLYSAGFAAKSLQLEMEALFDLIEADAKGKELREKFIGCIDEAGDELLHSLATERGAPPESRATLLTLAKRQDLEEYIKKRLEQIRTRAFGADKSTKFDSMFITDRFGTMLAAAFANESSVSRVGDNFAYRSYFSGQSQDLDERTPCRNIPRADSSHVSVPFLSTATGRWKIAVSTPIEFSEEVEGQTEPRIVEGVLVLTINLGDFELLSESNHSRGDDEHEVVQKQQQRFAVLVDGHVGDREGTILQHPVLLQRPENKQAGDRPNLQFQIDTESLKQLKDIGMYDYIDPVSKSDDKRAKEFEGEWIAAMVRVDVARRISGDIVKKQSTDLWVLVQERADSVTAPVQLMVIKLARLGLIALGTLLAVICALWYFVLKVMRLPDSFAAAARSRSPGTESLTGTGNEPTLDLDR